MNNNFEYSAKKYFEDKNYLECIKTCFQWLSTSYKDRWVYDLLGHAYMSLGMFSQARGCFAVAKTYDSNNQIIENYNSLIKLLYEKEKLCQK